MCFNYRQAIGELIFLMVTCRPDISFPLIKLSQYSNKPAKVHYKAVKQIFLYIQSTPDEGIHFWRPQPNDTLQTLPLPTPKENNDNPMKEHDSSTIMHANVDADWGGDTKH